MQAMKLYGELVIYISKHFLHEPWMEVSGLVHASAAFNPEKALFVLLE